MIADTRLKESNENTEMTGRDLETFIGLRTTLDKILFSISILLTVILFVLLYTLWRRWRQRKLRPTIGDEVKAATEQKKQKSEKGAGKEEVDDDDDAKYPIITIFQRSRSSPDEDSFASGSVVSSLYDTMSQQYDRSYFNETQHGKDVELGGFAAQLATQRELSNEASKSSEAPTEAGRYNGKITSLPVKGRPGKLENQSENVIEDTREDRTDDVRNRCFSI